MVTKEYMANVVEEYCRTQKGKDKSGWLSLFAADAVHEDPVGRRRNEGIEAISNFWDSFQSRDPELWTTEPPIVCGQEAIAIMRARTGPPDDRRESGTIVDQFVFDAEGRITALRVFYHYG